MSQSDLVLTPTQFGQSDQRTRAERSDHADRAASCRFAAHCSCVFQKTEPVDVPATGWPVYSDSVRTEMQSWERRGWVVIAAGSREVVLEKRNSIPLCLNVLLVAMTAFVWAIVWAVRSRKTLTQTRVLTIAPDGELAHVELTVGPTGFEPMTSTV